LAGTFALVAIASTGASSAARASAATAESKHGTINIDPGRVVLRQADLPDGWSSRSGKPTADDKRFATQLGRCLGHDSSLLSGLSRTTRRSRFIAADGGQSVQDTVSVARTVGAATTAVDATRSAKAPRCIRQVVVGAIEDVIRASGATATTVGDVAVTMIPFSNPGNAVQAFRIETPIESGAATANVYVDLYYIQQDRTVVTLACTATGTPVPPPFEQHLTSTLIGRLRRFS
jgi:hypothetical protein